jgi:hypothetical protein
MVTVWLCLSVSVRNMPEKHILEKLFGVGKLLVKLMATLSVVVLPSRVTTAASSTLLTLSILRDATKLIIHPALLLITEGHHGIIYALESLFCLRRTVFIRV